MNFSKEARCGDEQPKTVTSIQPQQTEVQSSSANGQAVEDVFAPIRRVSLDIDTLHEIFLYCMPVHPTIQLASPVISSLSRVSHTWSAAVRSSPRLWSRLFLTVQDDDDLGNCAQMVTQWFQRARSVPLSFFLNIDFEASDEDIYRIRSFLVDLSSVMLRVQHFGLHARLTTASLYSFVNVTWKLPHLKKLDLFSHDGLDQVNAVAFSVPLFQSAPNLTRIAVQNTITSARDIQHILPWAELTHINMVYSISIFRWIEVMKMCPSMLICDVCFDQQDEVATSALDSYSPKGIHESLERLDFNILEDGPPFLNLLSIYNFPSLKNLHVLYYSGPPPDFPRPEGITALANLRVFSFSEMGLNIEPIHFTYLSDILREMVNLEELELQQPTVDFVPLYEAMSFNRSEKVILPRLRTLKLWIHSDSVVENHDELQPLFKMLTSRCEEDIIPVGHGPLREFVVGVSTEGSLERIRKILGPWVGGLPPKLRVNIHLNRPYDYDQPPGWTFPISE